MRWSKSLIQILICLLTLTIKIRFAFKYILFNTYIYYKYYTNNTTWLHFRPPSRLDVCSREVRSSSCSTISDEWMKMIEVTQNVSKWRQMRKVIQMKNFLKWRLKMSYLMKNKKIRLKIISPNKKYSRNQCLEKETKELLSWDDLQIKKE